MTSPHLEAPRPHWHVLAPNRFDPFREEPLQVRGRQLLYFTLKRSRLLQARKVTDVSSLFLRRRRQPTARVQPTLLNRPHESGRRTASPESSSGGCACRPLLSEAAFLIGRRGGVAVEPGVKAPPTAASTTVPLALLVRSPAVLVLFGKR